MDKELKMYLVCRYDQPSWYYCFGLLSNGFCFGEHVCSDPGFAPNDLYFNRKERIDGLQEIFSIDPKIIKPETIVVKSSADKPEWWEELCNTQSVQDKLKNEYKKYKEFLEIKVTKNP